MELPRDQCWKQVVAELWGAIGDPWLILERVAQTRLETPAGDARFLPDLAEQVAAQ